MVEVRRATRGPRHHFFGYYDKCPWDSTERYLLALEVDFMDRAPRPSDVAVVGLVDLEEGCKWVPIAETRAWNWQQGCMLQWMPSAPHRAIIYNDRRGGRFVSVIKDVWSGEERVLPVPIYALSPDGRLALTLNFSRLQVTRPGYGYPGVDDPTVRDPRPRNDGIYLVDLESGEWELILSIAELAEFKPEPSMEGAVHWVNHILFSPDGRRFAFLHRWSRPGGWYTRLFTAEPDGSELYCVTNGGVVSHFCWRDSEHILAWALKRGVGEAFFLFTDLTGECEVVGEGVLTQNGHCSYSPDGRWILTDTYPDAEGFRHLLLYDTAEGRLVEVGKFYSPPELTGEIRCDLHPRWSRSGREVCIDSAHEGSRQVYVVDVSDVV